MKEERYCVAGHPLRIRYEEEEKEPLLSNFDNFRIAPDDGREDCFCVDVVSHLDNWDEEAHQIGVFDCGGNDYAVYRKEDGTYQFVIYNPQDRLCVRMIAANRFRHSKVMLVSPLTEDRRFGLNNSMMLAYSFSLCEDDTLLVHSSVIRHDGKGYMMTAPSGTGKSTHTYLWYKNIPGCDLMNDDNPIIRIVDGEAIVYGSPWSGKTPCYRNINAPIGGIVRIKQGPENIIHRLSPIEAFTMMLPACNNMKWDKRIYTSVCSTLTKLISATRLWELECRPDREAAIVCHNAVVQDS